MQPRNQASWRKQIPPSLELILQQAIKQLFYLLQKVGPTSFVLLDKAQKQFRVKISNGVSCSCDPTLKDHCLHSLYCMVRLLKVNQSDPILWQYQYSDYQLSDIVSGKYSSAKKRGNKKKLLELELEVEPQYCLRGEQDCPVCQEHMDKERGLTTCSQKCRSTFHLACAIIWVTHRKQEGDQVTCPLCRTPWGRAKVQELFQSQKRQKQRDQLNSYECKQCRTDIEGPLYICPVCPEYFLCKQCCTTTRDHVHCSFIFRARAEEWKAADPCRSLFQAVALYFQAYNKSEKKNLSKAEPRCMACMRSAFVNLRKLGCGHYIDQGCLKLRLELGNFLCSSCDKPFLAGMHNIEQRKEQLMTYNDRVRDIKRMQNQKQLQTVRQKLDTERRSASRQRRKSQAGKQMAQIDHQLQFIKRTEEKNSRRRAFHDSLERMIESAEQQSKRMIEEMRRNALRRNPAVPMPPKKR